MNPGPPGIGPQPEQEKQENVKLANACLLGVEVDYFFWSCNSDPAQASSLGSLPAGSPTSALLGCPPSPRLLTASCLQDTQRPLGWQLTGISRLIPPSYLLSRTGLSTRYCRCNYKEISFQSLSIHVQSPKIIKQGWQVSYM